MKRGSLCKYVCALLGYAAGSVTGNNAHALLWNGTNAAIDLNPTSGFTGSVACGVAGGLQVGYGVGPATGSNGHALLWSGSAASAFDLHSVLPANFTQSEAFSISGNTIYGWAQDTGGNYHAIAWSIPEPACLSLIAFGSFALFRRRCRAA